MTALFHWHLFHRKKHCVWCMNIEDDRCPDRKKGSLSQIGATSGWQAFKHHKVLIEVKELRMGIGRVT